MIMLEEMNAIFLAFCYEETNLKKQHFKVSGHKRFYSFVKLNQVLVY